MPMPLRPEQPAPAGAPRARATAWATLALAAAALLSVSLTGCRGIAADDEALERWGNDRVAGLRKVLDPRPILNAVGRRSNRFVTSLQRRSDEVSRRVGRASNTGARAYGALAGELGKRSLRGRNRLLSLAAAERHKLGDLPHGALVVSGPDELAQSVGRRIRNLRHRFPQVFLIDHTRPADPTDPSRHTGAGPPPRSASLVARILARLPF